MATDPITLQNLKQLRTFERQLRKFAVDYANGMTYTDMKAKFGFESREECDALAKELGFPRRRRRPPKRFREYRIPLKFEDLGIPTDFLYRYLNRYRAGQPSSRDFQIFEASEFASDAEVAERFGVTKAVVKAAVKRVTAWDEKLLG